MKLTWIIALLIIYQPCFSQQLNARYRTYTDSADYPGHYLIFLKEDQGKIYQLYNHPHSRGANINFTYSVNTDTIQLCFNFDVSKSKFLKELSNAKFIIRQKGYLVDSETGRIYIEKRKMDDNFYFFFIDGRFYKLRYDRHLFGKIFNPGWRLRHALKNIDTVNYSINLLKGKEAFDKYGVHGINPVIEVIKKN